MKLKLFPVSLVKNVTYTNSVCYPANCNEQTNVTHLNTEHEYRMISNRPTCLQPVVAIMWATAFRVPCPLFLILVPTTPFSLECVCAAVSHTGGSDDPLLHSLLPRNGAFCGKIPNGKFVAIYHKRTSFSKG